MRHVPEGTLRRLVDEPLAVSDRDTRHLEKCVRCRARSEHIAKDADAARRTVATIQLVPDADPAWSRFRGEPHPPNHVAVGWQVRRHRRWRLLSGSLSTGATVATVGVVIAGVAAAATLTTVFAPTKVAPVSINQADLQASVSILGLDSASGPGSFSGPSGSDALSFGVLRWNSNGRGERVSSLTEAEAVSGLTLTLPGTLPNGVGSPKNFVVGDTLTASVVFNAKAGSALAGSSLNVTIGPAIAVDYADAATGQGLPTLAIVVVKRPLATSSGASTSQLETFLLSQPGVPAVLAQELRLLGDLKTTLPVPAPAGAAVSSTEIGGSPAVLLTDSTGAASVVIWEDASGLVHAVGGLLDKGDVLSVAHQVG